LADPRRPLLALARFALRRDYRGERMHEWRRRTAGEPRLPPMEAPRILVLCHGNICRSPFAEALLRARCSGALVRSAGFAAGDGMPADPTAIEVAREWQIDLAPHRSRLLTPSELEWAQLVLVMTAPQARALVTRWSDLAPRVRLLGDYLSAAPFAIDDPYGCTPEVFRACFQRIDDATAQLSRRLASAGG
jgi:protein-tyrosine phosphatase